MSKCKIDAVVKQDPEQYLEVDLKTMTLEEGCQMKEEKVDGLVMLLNQNNEHSKELDLQINYKYKKQHCVRDCVSETFYQCEFCNEYFAIFELDEHIAFAHGVKRKLTCTICMKDFIPNGKKKTRKCEECVKETIKKMNTDVNCRYKCEICYKGFAYRCYLKRHMNNIHMNRKPFSCEICNKKFSERGNLKQHTVVHSFEHPHKCNYCNTSFRQHHMLKRHLLIHSVDMEDSVEQPVSYTCTVCQKCFNFKHSLVRHMRKHTGERPFKCNICAKTFKESGNLKRHESIHTRDIYYQCDVCGKRYVQKVALLKHILGVHMEKQIKRVCRFVKKVEKLKQKRIKHTDTDPLDLKSEVKTECSEQETQIDNLFESHKIKQDLVIGSLTGGASLPESSVSNEASLEETNKDI